MKNTHEQIIESEIFEQVQTEIKRRSNIEIINGKARGKGTHYSTKRTGHD